MGTLKMIRAFMYWPKSVIRKKKEGETKRRLETQRELMTAQKGTQIMGRARLCLSQHLVSRLRKSKGSVTSFFWRRTVRCVAAQDGNNELEGRARVWRTVFILCARRKSLLIWRNFGFYGSCTFEWPGLYDTVLYIIFRKEQHLPAPRSCGCGIYGWRGSTKSRTRS